MDYALGLALSSGLVFVMGIGFLIIGFFVYETGRTVRVERRGRRIQIYGGTIFGSLAFIGWFVSIWLAMAQAAGHA